VRAGDLITLSPLAVLSLSAVIVMLAAAFRRSHALALVLTLLGLAATIASLFVAATGTPRQVTPLLLLDTYALFFIGLLTLATAVVAILSWGYLQRRRVPPEEYYVLLLTATLGGATLVASTHFASFFLGLEILSVSLYALIAYPIFREQFVEAAIKYLVLAGATSAALVFGMALVYAETGSMTVSQLAPAFAAELTGSSALVAVGVVLIVVGVGFKLALVPLHMWTPDIYQGAPAPVTAYIATVSKGAMFALLVRFFRPVSLHHGGTLFLVFAGIALASMVAGNLLALRQANVKRILAYSSIANLGYALVAFLAAGQAAVTAVAFFLVAYFVTSLTAFGVVTVLSSPLRDAESMSDYRGLAQSRPWLAAIFSVALFSLAGIPLTMGFVGKFYLIAAGADAALWALVITLVLSSTIGLYYYTRIVVAMYVEPAEEGHVAVRSVIPGSSGVVLAALTALLLIFGVYPSPLIHLIERAVSTLP
jgi:NADH-quinone oxidoreductase subunit N